MNPSNYVTQGQLARIVAKLEARIAELERQNGDTSHSPSCVCVTCESAREDQANRIKDEVKRLRKADRRGTNWRT